MAKFFEIGHEIANLATLPCGDWGGEVMWLGYAPLVAINQLPANSRLKQNKIIQKHITNCRCQKWERIRGAGQRWSCSRAGL